MKTVDIKIGEQVIITREDIYVEMETIVYNLHPNLMISKGAKGLVGRLEIINDNVIKINVVFALTPVVSIGIWLSPEDLQVLRL